MAECHRACVLTNDAACYDEQSLDTRKGELGSEPDSGSAADSNLVQLAGIRHSVPCDVGG